jgi:hypothetical protein
MKLRSCDRCACAGVIRVNYHSGEPFDIAICDCPAGQIWRHQDDIDGTIRARLQLDAAHQVALVEDFDPETEMTVHPSVMDFTEAGKVGKRAKL